MYVTTCLRLRDFHFWGGAKDRAAALTCTELARVEPIHSSDNSDEAAQSLSLDCIALLARLIAPLLPTVPREQIEEIAQELVFNRI